MKRSKYLEEKIVCAIRQAEADTLVRDICRMQGLIGRMLLQSPQHPSSLDKFICILKKSRHIAMYLVVCR